MLKKKCVNEFNKRIPLTDMKTINICIGIEIQRNITKMHVNHIGLHAQAPITTLLPTSIVFNLQLVCSTSAVNWVWMQFFMNWIVFVPNRTLFFYLSLLILLNHSPRMT